MRKQEQTAVTPSVFQAIATGFDLTAKHLWLLVLPVLLDAFLWLGPQMHFQTLIERIVDSLPQEANLTELVAPLVDAAPRTNLFTVLSVPFVGVPTLMSMLSPETVPLQPVAYDIDSWGIWIALFVGMIVFGLLLTAVYYVMIASVVNPWSEGVGLTGWAAKVGITWIRLLVLALFFLVISLIIYLPVSFVGAVAFMIAAPIGSLIMLIAPIILIWVVVYLSVAPQIIVLEERPALRAARESMRFVQQNMLAVFLLLLLILLASTVVNWLLVLAENGTWLTLLNILGHAFVSTALVTAIFVFCRDRTLLISVPDHA
jgi:hypothetical protein